MKNPSIKRILVMILVSRGATGDRQPRLGGCDDYRQHVRRPPSKSMRTDSDDLRSGIL